MHLDNLHTTISRENRLKMDAFLQDTDSRTGSPSRLMDVLYIYYLTNTYKWHYYVSTKKKKNTLSLIRGYI